MGFLSGMTSGIYRYTVDGRRIYNPRVLPGHHGPFYLVSDDDAMFGAMTTFIAWQISLLRRSQNADR